MRTYRIVFSMSYDIKAEDEETAEEQATTLFLEDVPVGETYVSVFNCTVKDITK